jgi:hypothetical protein
MTIASMGMIFGLWDVPLLEIENPNYLINSKRQESPHCMKKLFVKHWNFLIQENLVLVLLIPFILHP